MGRLNSLRLKTQDSRLKVLVLSLGSIVCLTLAGCSISYGVYHTVEEGQTLWRIARTYDVDIQDVAEMNDIVDVTHIKVGQDIFIPGAWQILKVEPSKPTDSRHKTQDTSQQTQDYRLKTQDSRTQTTSHTPLSEDKSDGEIVLEKWRFLWPVNGKVISSFGIRNGKRHDGIDIAASAGSSVFAAQDGEVIYSNDGIRGYGNIVMLSHREGFITVYAHNKENLVKVGSLVKRGEIIAKLGSTGNASGPHLHFEVRRDRKPRNPLFFLP